MTEPGELAGARAPLPEDVALLRQRAAQLARAPTIVGDTPRTRSLVFRLGGEDYALASAVTLQVAVLRELTPLPRGAAPLFGVTHWRGEVLTILDLREVLGARVRGVTDLSRVVVIDGTDRVFGIIADAVTDMIDIDEEDVRPLPAEDGRGSLLRGMTGTGVLVVDADALVARYGTVSRRQQNKG
jgi:purine-binding chemotaxis protein CheW